MRGMTPSILTRKAGEGDHTKCGGGGAVRPLAPPPSRGFAARHLPRRLRDVGGLLAVSFVLTACTTAAAPEGGVASYDDLRKATAACEAKGGTLTLKTMGDSQYIEDYACKRN